MNDRQQVKSWVEASSHEGWLAKLAQWYERDWQNAIDSVSKGQQQSPPDASEIISLLPEEKREVARSTVQSIDEYYRETYQSKSSHRAGGHADSHLTEAVFVDSAGSDYATLDGDSHALSVDEPAVEPMSRLTGGFDQATLDGDLALAETPPAIDQPTMDSADVAEIPSVRVGGLASSNAVDLQATGDFSVGELAKSPTVRRGRRTMGHTAGDSSSVPAINFRVGDLVGDYRIERVLGRGGMGIVFLARQMKLDRLVALKMILAAGDGVRESQLARFEAEAKAIAKFQHENIVRIFETGNHDGMPYFSLEYIEGESLSELMHDGPLEFIEAARLGAEIGRGIHYAHTQGIVHRDLKPANVLLTLDDQAKVTDFGLAKEVESDQSLSIDGAVVGTPGFMAPEQVTQSHDIGPPADVWGLGSVLYAMLTGQPPFLGANRGESMMMLIQQEPPRPSRVRPGIPIDLETICLKCLEKDPAKRYESAEAVAEDLDRYQRGEPISARAITRTERTWRWCKRNPKIALPSAAAASLAIALAIGGPVVAGKIYQQKKTVEETNTKLAVSEADAREKEIVAIESKQAAEKGLKNATDALKVVIFKTTRSLEDRPGMAGVRQSLIETARTQLGLTDNSIDPELQSSVTVARTLVAMGEMNMEMGRVAAAKKNFADCLTMINRLDEAGELSESSRFHNLSKAEDRVGQAANKLGDLLTAKKHFTNAVTYRRQWLAEKPSDPMGVVGNLAESLGALGTAEKYLGNFDIAEKYFDESLELRRRRSNAEPGDLYVALGELGSRRALILLDDERSGPETAVEAMESLVKEFDDLSEKEVATMVIRANTALAHGQLGDMQLGVNRNEAASKSFQRSVEIFINVLAEEPERGDLKSLLGDAIDGVLIAESRNGRSLDDEKLDVFIDRLAKVRRELIELDPFNTDRRYAAIRSFVRLKRYSEAIGLAGDLKDPSSADDDLWLSSAMALSMLSSIPDEVFAKTIVDGKKFRSGQFAERAVAVLRAGIENNRIRPNQLSRVDDLQPIRDRPDFEDLVTRVHSEPHQVNTDEELAASVSPATR